MRAAEGCGASTISGPHPEEHALARASRRMAAQVIYEKKRHLCGPARIGPGFRFAHPGYGSSTPTFALAVRTRRTINQDFDVVDVRIKHIVIAKSACDEAIQSFFDGYWIASLRSQ